MINKNCAVKLKWTKQNYQKNLPELPINPYRGRVICIRSTI